MSLDPAFERSVIAEFAHRERQARRTMSRRDLPAALAWRVHRSHEDLLAHLQRVATGVPPVFRPVAWLHHARETYVTARDLTAAGLSRIEVEAIDLLAGADPLHRAPPDLGRALTVAAAPGSAGHLARVVGRAALTDLLRHGLAAGDHVTALHIVSHPPTRSASRHS